MSNKNKEKTEVEMNDLALGVCVNKENGTWSIVHIAFNPETNDAKIIKKETDMNKNQAVLLHHHEMQKIIIRKFQDN